MIAPASTIATQALPVTPAFRYERKFLPDRLSPSAAEASLKLHPALFARAFPERTVNNIYLDSPDLRHYLNHLNGAAERLKVRIRWYGTPLGGIPRPVLELKHKRGDVGHKQSYPLPPLSFQNGFCPDAVRAILRDADLPDLARSQVLCLEPLLFNSYQRRYFCSADGRYRVTLDFNLKFARPRRGLRLPPEAFHPFTGLILELKYAPEDAPGVESITNRFPFRLTRFSKYVAGIDAS